MKTSGTTDTAAPEAVDYRWTPQPAAARVVAELLGRFCEHCDPARELAARLKSETGTRLLDWCDYLVVAPSDELGERLQVSGFLSTPDDGRTLWHHPGGLFPKIYTGAAARDCLAIRVDSLEEFLHANQLGDLLPIEGEPGGPMAKARLYECDDAELWIVERHGFAGFEPQPAAHAQFAAVDRHRRAFGHRRRDFPDPHYGFEHARHLFDAAAAELGRDWACDLFFAEERAFWQRRNRAAQAQKERQDVLGVGWANHDHHTYRSSRAHFASLIGELEHMGFYCRERFYAGLGAGWGAQVLEQPACRVVIFADVDLSPDDVRADFAHSGLPDSAGRGTVGLWCELHGEAFLDAGMHHLECQFDFDEARHQLAAVGFPTMKPFTNFPHLKQAFTEGERWPVREERIASLVERGLLSPADAAEFRERGAIGSHLEILERNDGYQGFNQTGIDEIIAATDPRRA